MKGYNLSPYKLCMAIIMCGIRFCSILYCIAGSIIMLVSLSAGTCLEVSARGHVVYVTVYVTVSLWFVCSLYVGVSVRV